MKIFTQKSITQKIIIAIIFVILFNFIMPNISFADTDGSGVAGKLFKPVKEFLLGISDAVMWGMNKLICGLDETFLDLKYNDPNKVNWIQWLEGAIGATAAAAIIGFFLGGPPGAAVFAAGASVVESGHAGFLVSISANPPNGSIPEILKLPLFVVTPEEIFSDKLPLLDVNFFNPTSKYKQENIIEKDGETYIKIYDAENGISEDIEMKSSALELQPTISKWYYAIRNFAIVALLSILVYIAIRIIISSSMEDRAKYKSRLLDWLIAMCLVFFMHYIMSFAVTVTEEITKAVVSVNYFKTYEIKNHEGDERLLSDYSIEGVPVYESNFGNEEEQLMVWPTNLMGKVRLDLQFETASDNQNLMKSFSLTVIYMGMVMYTILFLFRYIKRLIILAFLTIIAPLVAMTYPLDKIHDNSAQGFDTWIKEYIFNLLIQPVHLILYTVLIGTALDFASQNVIYSLVAFGFILQAEKIMRKLFGFNKAETASATSAALGGAIAMKGMNALTSHFKGGNNKDKGEEEKNKIAQANRKPDKDINQLTQSVFGSRENNGGQGPNNGSDQENGQGDSQNGQGDNQNSQGDNQNSQGDNQNSQGNAQNSGANDQNNGGQPNSQNSENSNDTDAPIVISRQAQIIAEEQNRTRKKLEDSKIRNLANKVGNSKFSKGVKYVGPKFAKTGLKGALKVGLMATGATIGLTAGLVSDDFSNVAKYGLAGAGAGLLAGKGITNKIANMKDGISKEYENFYEATHTKDEINERSDQKALEDKERIKKYQEKFGVDKAGAQRIMKEVAQEYRAYGITNDDIIIKMIKNESLNDNEKLMVAKMASQVDGDEAKYDALKEGLSDRGISSQEAEKYLQIIRDLNNWV